MAPEAREKARKDADEMLASLKRGAPVQPPKPDGAVGEIVTAGFTQLGIVPWGVAMDLADGAWSEVIEEVGRFVILKRIKRIDGPVPMATQFEVDVLAFRGCRSKRCAPPLNRARQTQTDDRRSDVERRRSGVAAVPHGSSRAVKLVRTSLLLASLAASAVLALAQNPPLQPPAQKPPDKARKSRSRSRSRSRPRSSA